MADDDPKDGKTKEYTVGYGRPPTHSRFKPGQSGNPRGKRKSAKSFSVIARATLNEKVTVRTPRSPKRMSKLEALLQTSLNDALKPEADKVVRMQACSAMIEDGAVLIPMAGTWLGEFQSELLAFPNGVHDDQVDALSQLINWNRTKSTYTLDNL